jgi:hypothetical protein
VDEIEDGPTLEYTITSELFRCCGCYSITLRRTTDYGDFGPDTATQYFPPAVSRHLPSWWYEIPEQLKTVLAEVYRSLDADTRSLPIMGARALIDMLILEKVGDVGTFGEKLKGLEGLGVISPQNSKVLSAALDVGNAAAHRGHSPKIDEVNAVMDIVENLLHAVYILPGMAEKLKKTTPPRPGKKMAP